MLDMDFSLVPYNREELCLTVASEFVKNLLLFGLFPFERHFPSKEAAFLFTDKLFAEGGQLHNLFANSIKGLLYDISTNTLHKPKTVSSLTEPFFSESNIVKNGQHTVLVTCHFFEVVVVLERLFREEITTAPVPLREMAQSLFVQFGRCPFRAHRALKFHLDRTLLLHRSDGGFSAFARVVAKPDKYLPSADRLNWLRKHFSSFCRNCKKCKNGTEDTNASQFLSLRKDRTTTEKSVVLVTNSPKDYVEALMPLCFGKNWARLFSAIVTSADKPVFFLPNNGRAFLRTKPLSNCFSGGSFLALLADLGCLNDTENRFFLIEDSILSGVLKPLESLPKLVPVFLYNSEEVLQNCEPVFKEVRRASGVAFKDIFKLLTQVEVLEPNKFKRKVNRFQSFCLKK